ncbi:MAG: hypothetical protein ACI4I2_04875 [Oscillospiraceae bacterium]
MTKEQYRKFAFVTHELDQLVKKINPNIHHITYIEQNGLVETVDIHFSDGLVRTVNISGDSLLAITKDVLKHI